MIRRIQQIKDFGVFADFQWPAGLPDFKQFNLIYGWNYSGKTTLSRAFRCFELKKCHADFASAQVQLATEDGTVHHLSTPNTAPTVRVFNSDFVRENLSFAEGTATPILVVGADDIARQKTLKVKTTERDALVQSRTADEGKRIELETAIETALTNYARDSIKNPLSRPGYDRRDFLPKVLACKATPETYLLDDQSLERCFTIYNSTDKKPTLVPKVATLHSVIELRERASVLLARVVTASSPIARLTENPKVEKWVMDGRSLHEDKIKCQFCDQQLPSDLLAHLAGHFSADYDDLMRGLSALANDLQTAQEEKISLDYRADFYTDLQELFVNEQTRLEALLKVRKAAIVTLELNVLAKQTQAFTSLECPVVDDPGDQIARAVSSINAIISDHNSRTAGFDNKRREAFESIEMHYAASFVRDQKYSEHLQKTEQLITTIAEQGRNITALDTEIEALERVVSEPAKGAERINQLLALYFSKTDLSIIVASDNRFQITSIP